MQTSRESIWPAACTHFELGLVPQVARVAALGLRLQRAHPPVLLQPLPILRTPQQAEMV